MTPTVFVELCAGLGALSLSAVAGRPIPNVWARPGGKTGYARVIWRALGLSGWRPSRIVWAEPDPACRVMLAAYSRPDVLREAAAWCRRWGAEYGEEGQRRLWEDLRAEGPPDEGAADMGREVARVGAVQRRTVSQAGTRVFGGGGGSGDWVPKDYRQTAHATGGLFRYGSDAPAAWFGDIPARWPETVLHRDGREVQPIPGAVVVIDPPYLGTHGYEAGGVLPRADVVAMARRWAEAGAVVAVCEAVPVAQEMGPGWVSIDITGEREGPARGALGGTVTEWLTLSRPAVVGWRTQGQVGLFG
jgi:hypothetical protein